MAVLALSSSSSRDFAEGRRALGLPHLDPWDDEVGTDFAESIGGEEGEFILLSLVKGKDALGPDSSAIDSGVKDVNVGIGVVPLVVSLRSNGIGRARGSMTCRR